MPPASAASSRARASAGLWPTLKSARYASSITAPAAADGGGAPSAEGTVRANRVTFRFRAVTTVSPVALPNPGSVDSHLTSSRWMASATSRGGRARALSAFRTPTLSTVHSSSKNARSSSVANPTSRGTRRFDI